ncbi:Nucleic acid-binding OB-fold domain-containing protein [Paragonimus skrjabini miyazakii]|uniref:CST complex subunit STN1 n=1 Tax=Paragonimus skrjabini miyazakii TaxID=59628 RepID=A0A8S9Y934_9TREM|nr:Nucleic acid-binding OB-fold domain-containing protein [Paragonimus skrjabini miyazakii]
MSLSSLDDSQWLSAASLLIESPTKTSNSIILDPLANEHYQLLIGDLLGVQFVGDLDVFRLGTRWILNADICGVVRTIHEREKFSMIEVDDGTGCICCTVWRQTNPAQRIFAASNSAVPNNYSDYRRVCDQLVQMALDYQPTHTLSLSPKHIISTRRLQLGSLVHLRGRVKRFRGKLKLNVYYCRLLKDPAELLIQIIHRESLLREVYSHVYDAQSVAKHVVQSRCMNDAKTAVTEACRILSEDGLHTFTKLDLCLNSRLSDILCSESSPMAFDESESVFLHSHSTEPSGSRVKELQTRVDNLVQLLLQGGWIYPLNEPIGSHFAFRTVSDDRALRNCVLEQIGTIESRNPGDQSSDVSFKTVLNKLRRDSAGDWSRLTPAALCRILDRLETDSCIYQTNPQHYRLA